MTRVHKYSRKRLAIRVSIVVTSVMFCSVLEYLALTVSEDWFMIIWGTAINLSAIVLLLWWVLLTPITIVIGDDLQVHSVLRHQSIQWETIIRVETGDFATMAGYFPRSSGYIMIRYYTEGGRERTLVIPPGFGKPRNLVTDIRARMHKVTNACHSST